MYAPDQDNACVGKQLTTMSHPLAMLLLTIKNEKMNFKTIKKAMALALFTSCSYILQAQLKLSGFVSDPDKKSIPFSVVGIKNTFLSTQSNSAGLFEFANLKPGTYVLVTKCVGYKVK